jgi:hypothetical protein
VTLLTRRPLCVYVRTSKLSPKSAKTEVCVMLKRRLASALSCAALLLAGAPSAALSQTQRAAAAERSLTAALPEKRPELKALFFESAARARAGALTETDFKRFEAKRWQDDKKQEPEKKWTKGHKAFVIILVAAVTAACVWAIANPGDDPPPDCVNDPSNILCTTP